MKVIINLKKLNNFAEEMKTFTFASGENESCRRNDGEECAEYDERVSNK